MDVRLVLLRPVTDGTGAHGIGSEYTCDSAEANRLVRLGGARLVSPPVSQVFNGSDEDAEDTEVEEEEEEDIYMSEEEYEGLIQMLGTIDGVTRVVAERLIEAGFQSVSDVANATDDTLTTIEGIGKKSAVKILAAAQRLL